MFGQNDVDGQKHFADARGRLMVTSIFATLQGEGPFQGRPAIFVRLSKCNLACSFCDTFFDAGDWFTIDDLLDAVEAKVPRNYTAPYDMVLVITGGEPMLQANVTPFIIKASKLFRHVQIESNGILAQPLAPTTVLIVSPKSTEGANPHYIIPKGDSMSRASALKFVMSSDSESVYHRIPDWAFAWKHQFRRPIYVSPMNCYKRFPSSHEQYQKFGIDPVKPNPDGSDFHIMNGIDRRSANEVVSFWEGLGSNDPLLDYPRNRANHEYAAKYALENGLYLTLQMHLYASLA